MTGFMYILHCADDTYYTGSTTQLELRLSQHESGVGANHTQKRLPVELVYVEKYEKIETAFYREKQIQGWGRKKKEALIQGELHLLPELAVAYRDKSGFESLPHQECLVQHENSTPLHPLPEALEGNIANPPHVSGFESLSHQASLSPPKSQ